MLPTAYYFSIFSDRDIGHSMAIDEDLVKDTNDSLPAGSDKQSSCASW